MVVTVPVRRKVFITSRVILWSFGRESEDPNLKMSELGEAGGVLWRVKGCGARGPPLLQLWGFSLYLSYFSVSQSGEKLSGGAAGGEVLPPEEG